MSAVHADDFKGALGSARARNAIAHLDSELHQALPGGDHMIMMERVMGAESDPYKRPLLYFRRAYCTLAGG